MTFLKTGLIILTLCAFFIACSESKSNNSTTVSTNTNVKAPTEAKPSATADEFAASRTSYKTNCVKCHKEDGSGGKVDIDGITLNSEDLTSEKMKKMSDEKYVKYIAKGVVSEGMPAFEDKLSEQEIKDMIKFIRAEFQK